jgi:MFS superfamily sulfate permease-like transporter
MTVARPHPNRPAARSLQQASLSDAPRLLLSRIRGLSSNRTLTWLTCIPIALLGLGLANFATATFSGFPVTGAFTRSTINSEAGARTVMAGVFSGAILSIVVSFLTSWFYYLPDVSLAALIVFSAVGLLESNTIRYLWTVDRGDAAVWAITVSVTFVAGIELGLLVGAGVSVLRIVEKAAQPHTAVLGRMPDGVSFRNVRRFPTLALPVPGLAIVRLDGPLFFANVVLFVDRVVRAAFPSGAAAA